MNNIIGKLKKITNAVYDLIDFLPESEPLKFKIKEKALEIFEKIIILEGSHSDLKINELEKNCTEILNSIILMGQYLEFLDSFDVEEKELQENLKEAYSRLYKYIFDISKNRETIESRTRIQKTLNFLKKEKQVKMSDLLKLFNNKISERTIRRDLNVLLERGIIEREGEKRLTKYVLKRVDYLTDI